MLHGRTAHSSGAAPAVKRRWAAACKLLAMRVAIDARALMGPQTGIGTYTLGIARALNAMPGVEVGLFAPRPLSGAPTSDGLQVHLGPAIPGLLWTQAAFSRRAADWGADGLLAALTI